jgi:hypothetical protein
VKCRARKIPVSFDCRRRFSIDRGGIGSIASAFFFSLAAWSHDMIKPMLATLTFALCIALTACGSTKTVVKSDDNCGKQLTDLQNALSSGAMSQSEYDRARQAAIERCNHT